MSDLDGLRALVTGGGRGIGAATCVALAEAGASVLVHYRNRRQEALAVRDRLAGGARRQHRVRAADLASPDAIEDLFRFVEREWGVLDLLVNNAGIWTENRLDRFDAERFERTWQVNLRAPFLCAARALPLLRASERAGIINITSTAGQRGEAGYSPYAASKGAMIAATKSWAAELAPEIRVNSVAPGWVDTEMCVQPFAGDGRARIEAGIPAGRVADPSDIAHVVVFLASPRARHLHGATVSVNGGAVLVGG